MPLRTSFTNRITLSKMSHWRRGARRRAFSSRPTVRPSVERLARRIHAASDRAAFPFVRVAAATLPIDAAVLTERCADLLDTARGGSLLLTDVEQMPAFVQNRLVETFDCLQAALEPTCRVRLLAGTTTALYERIADGTFAERLFYRLNIIHLVDKNGAGDSDSAGGGSTG